MINGIFLKAMYIRHNITKLKGGINMYLFLSKDHESRFEELCKRDRTHFRDMDRRALFFVIAGDQLLFKYVDLLYDFNGSSILLEVYDQPFLTGDTRCLIDLAFNLYGSDAVCEIHSLFNTLDHYKSILAFNAIKYRFQILEVEKTVSL